MLLMKRLLVLLLAVFTITASAQAKSLQIGDETFHLKDAKKSDAASLEEYLPKGQTFDNWKKLVAVRQFFEISSPKDYVGNMVADYQRKYPEMKFEAGSGPGGLYYLDCIMYPLGGGPKFVEWNYFIARPAKTGIIVYQYAERAPYQRDIEEAFKALDVKSLRKRMLPILQKSLFVTQSAD